LRQAIIITGTNHSGTSAMTRFLMNNGYDTGECFKDHEMAYETYENNLFRKAVRMMLGLEDGTNGDIFRLNEMLNDMQHERIVMKYPRAIFVLDNLLPLFVDTGWDVKLIHMYRDVNKYLESYSKKVEGTIDYVALMHEQNLGLAAASRKSIPTRIQPYERILRDEVDIASFLGITNPMDITGIDGLPLKGDA